MCRCQVIRGLIGALPPGQPPPVLQWQEQVAFLHDTWEVSAVLRGATAEGV